MENDPWADAPPSKPSTPVAGSSSKQTSPQSPLTSVLPAAAPSLGSADGGEDASFKEGEDQPEASGSSLRPPSPIVPGPEADEGGFDDFDDFDAPAGAPVAGGDGQADLEGGEDAFGDFGDFEEGDFDQPIDTGGEITAPPPPPVIEASFQALRLDPQPSRSALISQLSTLLSPLTASASASAGPSSSAAFTEEPLRLASSSRQIMITEASRDAYVQLASPPQLKSLDWTRSRVRREHLIHMGIPVNLDEVDSHRLSTLPPLTISTNFANLPPLPRGHHRRSDSLDNAAETLGRRGSGDVNGASGSARVNGANQRESVDASGSSQGRGGQYGIGTPPELDQTKAEELCGIDEDQLSILPPSALKKLQDDLVATSAQASALLAWRLQLKDAQSQDAATYNGMISELIANAAKAKSAQQAGSGGVFKRGSIRRPTSGVTGSGGVSPRVASPAMR